MKRPEIIKKRPANWLVLSLMFLMSILFSCKPDINLTLSDLEFGFYKTDVEYIKYKLNETFSPKLLNYTATVEKSYTATVILTPFLAENSTGKIKINGQDVNSGDRTKIDLKLGENPVDIIVSTEDGKSKTYKVNISQEDWSKVYLSELVSPGIWRLWDFGGFIGNENMFLIEGQDKALLFDTGMGTGDLAAYVKTLTNLPVDVAITHGNRDHFMQVDQFKESTVYISKKDITRLPENLVTSKFQYIEDGDIIDIGAGRSFEVIEVPGHTMGCVLFVDRKNKIAVTGDGIGSGDRVHMYNMGTCPLDQYLAGLKKAEEKLSDVDSLDLLTGHYFQESTPLKGVAGKQLLVDMRILAEKVLAGEIIGETAITARGGVTQEYKKAYYGLAGMYYNPYNKVTHPASLVNLYIQKPSGAVIITNPVFASFVTEYTAKVPADLTSVDFIPYAYDPSYKSMTINGKAAKAEAVFNARIVPGNNKFIIKTTAGDGSTGSYTITITR